MQPLTESDLTDLGVWRVPVPVPFAHAGGPANVYLIEQAGGGLLLFDAGLGTPEAEEALREGFRRSGKRFSDIERIVISHGHVDHFGAARTLVEWSGGEVPVQAHPEDIPKIAAGGSGWGDRFAGYARYFAKLGVPPQAMAESANQIQGGLRLARPIEGVLPIAAGVRLSGKWVSLDVHHMPGHTPGVICLHDPEHRLLFSDDHLLEKISPNPLIELGPEGEEGWFRPLVAYLESLERVRALEVDLVLPGHNVPFSGHRRVIESLLAFLDRRQERIQEALARGPLTAWELARALFPNVRGSDAFLSISETVANLELLETRSRVARALEGGVYRFRLSS